MNAATERSWLNQALSADSAAVKSIDHCPACGEAARVALGGVAPGLTTSVAGRDFHQPAYQVQECAQCGLLYKDKVLADEALAAYYAQLDFKKWEIPDFFPNERAVHDILRQLPANARILDFGCSSGRLLAPLVGDYACYGIEINAAAAQAAAAKGLTMLPPEELHCSEAFDAIVLIDVFEHLTSPTALLLQLVEHVTARGVLIVGTGNADAAACRLDPGQFWYFRNVEHLCMLSRKSAHAMAAALGLTLAGWQELSHYDTSLHDRLVQSARHFAYWKFHFGSPLEKRLLAQVPGLKRAQKWPVAPAYTCSNDHVIATFGKNTNDQ